ncbi:putative serine carboxypeptidase-like 23 [Cryptomeria japonica]|uniref:putative serine carboxypeptidase-like 23 n=1 Tax=Cryptomeria japonica TaxID=3369 RepID=UPI0027DA2FA4|nr:putative serine carboxypeptidase-like 23 [Cryptomeria japonica]
MEQSDLIKGGLPGQPYANAPFQQYAGYVSVDDSSGRYLFYYFAEAYYKASKKPLILWLNGGPGCSSVGYGAMQELGPFRVNPNGRTLRTNRNSWNTVANILFLDSPAGVGFSYSRNKSDYDQNGDAQTAEDNYSFLVNWFNRYPNYKNRDFYIAGESYAGNYIPQLAAKILEHRKQSQASFINLKGLMIGNGDLSITTDNMGEFVFAWSHALISDKTFYDLVDNCVHVPFINPNSSTCSALLNKKSVEMGNIDPYAIYSPRCTDNSSTGASLAMKQGQTDPYDPCSKNYILNYMNIWKVQKAFHLKKSVKWGFCSNRVFEGWNDYVPSVLPIYPQLMSAGLRILLYSGDTDSVVSVTGTREALADLNLTIETPWYPWVEDPTKTDGEVGGYSEVYKGNLTFASVRNAGHEVPIFEPMRILTLLKYFLAGQPPPMQRYT